MSVRFHHHLKEVNRNYYYCMTDDTLQVIHKEEVQSDATCDLQKLGSA